MKSLFAAILLLATPAIAHAQGYIIQQPGQLPSYANPTPNGGWVVTQPGQLPTTVTPSCGFGGCRPAWTPSSPMQYMPHYGR